MGIESRAISAKIIRRVVDQHSPSVCALILIGLLSAAFWPFKPFPKNGVGWLESENGLRFLGDGIAFSTRPIPFKEFVGTNCSVEIWLKAANNWGSSTILDFHRDNPPGRLAILQHGNSGPFVVKSEHRRAEVMGLEHTFHPDESTLVTVASGFQGTTVYFDGAAVKTSAHFEVLHQHCSGVLVIGTAAESRITWNGDLLGLAVYSQDLTQSQVMRHYDAWSTKGHLEIDPSENMVALYLFGERSGNVAHNEIIGEADLYIPTSFQIPYPSFLEMPWKELQGKSIDWKDVASNVAGFIPLGFFLFSFLLSTRHRNRAVFATVILGMLVSLTIEVLQSYFPTRHPSTIDVITNVLGTGVGVILHRFAGTVLRRVEK